MAYNEDFMVCMIKTRIIVGGVGFNLNELAKVAISKHTLVLLRILIYIYVVSYRVKLFS